MFRIIGWIVVITGLLTRSLYASESPSLTDWVNHTESGAMLMRAGDGSAWTPALLLATEVDIQVSGPVAQVTVKQRFANRGADFAEGVYVFPLAETSAVHGMLLEVGERRILGQIKEKQQARQIYQQARDAGQRAGLVEQQRPNMFTTSVANITAGEEITVTLQYTELLVPDGNRFSLRFPLTMTPRYTPMPQTYTEDGAVVVSAPTEPSPTGPILPTGDFPQGSHQVRISTYIDAGQRVSQLSSPTHTIHQDFDGQGHQVVLPEEAVPMDRDFVLEWQLDTGLSNQALLFSEVLDGDNHALLMLMPAQRQIAEQRMPREVVLVIDTSGSMSGERIRQARRSLIHALDRLRPEDRFNVLEFNHRHSLLYRDLVPATAANVEEARQWVSRLRADGGTEMLPVLRDALAFPSDPDYLRQIIFITDGSVSNEAAVLELIHQRIQRGRLFTVGIGAAPNSYLLRKAAETGRGRFTYINRSDEVAEQMNLLFEKLEMPVLTDLRIELPAGIVAEYWPEQLPDLYVGQPLVVAMKLNRMPDSITVHGRQPEPWRQQASIPSARQHPGIATLWAREKIGSLMDRLTRGEPEEQVREEVLEVALKHQLMSRYTSFVAVEETPVRAADEALVQEAVANRNPVDHGYPQTSLGLLRLWLLALALLAAAALLMPRRRVAA